MFHRELQQTLQSVNTIQEEKESLSKATEELQQVLQVSVCPVSTAELCNRTSNSGHSE